MFMVRSTYLPTPIPPTWNGLVIIGGMGHADRWNGRVKIGGMGVCRKVEWTMEIGGTGS